MKVHVILVFLGLALISCAKEEGSPSQAKGQDKKVEVERESAGLSDTKTTTKRKSETTSAKMGYIILAHAESRLGDLQTRSLQETLELAKSLAERIRGGESITILAKEFSDDPDLKSHGGELIVLNSGNDSTEGTPRARLEGVADQLFQLQKAAVSVVVPEDPRTSLGIWIIQRMD